MHDVKHQVAAAGGEAGGRVDLSLELSLSPVKTLF